MKKLQCLYLSVLFLFFCGIGLQASAENYIIKESFQNENVNWSGGTVGSDDDISCYKADGEITCSLPTMLSQDTAYLLRFYVRQENGQDTLPYGRILSNDDASNLVFGLYDVSATWRKIEIRFIADRDGIQNITLTLLEPIVSTLYIHSVELLPVPFTPSKMAIIGRRNVTIDHSNEAVYSYAPAVMDKWGNGALISGGYIFATGAFPTGVTFDSLANTLRISSSTISGTTVRLSVLPTEKYPAFSTETIQIYLSKQVLINGSFDDVPLLNGWDTMHTPFSVLEDKDRSTYYAQIPTEKIGDNLYGGSIMPALSYFLKSDTMYVFRGRIRTEEGYETRQMFADTILNAEENNISFHVSQIGGDTWTEVISAFRVPRDDTYTFSFSFFAPDIRPVYVDSIVIRPETPSPADIVFDAPVHATIPLDEPMSFPLACAVRDQTGAILPDEATLGIISDTQDVVVDGNALIISPDAKEGEYTITASLASDPDISGTHTLYISHDAIGDGSFEKTAPGQWWATAQPSNLHFLSSFSNRYPTDGGLLARLTMNGPVSVLLADSVYRYTQGTSYIFEADMSVIVPDIDTIVTVLVDNIESDSFDDNLVIGQFTLNDKLQRIETLFTPSTSVTGRLMVAFNTPESHDQQIIALDHINLMRAVVKAENVTITGTPIPDRDLTGNYRFTSNFDAIDASKYSWLLSDKPDGVFMPMENQNHRELSVTSDLNGKYVKFEVTPVSMRGPVVGASVTSSAIRIGTFDGSIIPSNPLPSEPQAGMSQPSQGENNVSTPELDLQFVDITKWTDTFTRNIYVDTESHWAKEDIAIMTDAGIVNGRGDGLFAPDEKITRAEFSAILARAFSFAPTFYTGKFLDVHAYDWYAGVVETVTKHGIAQGTSAQTFSPNLPITREQMATMIMRAYKQTGAKSAAPIFAHKDVAEFSAWAVQNIGEANALGILKGMPDGHFLPKQNATRAEALVSIRRMLIVMVNAIRSAAE